MSSNNQSVLFLCHLLRTYFEGLLPRESAWSLVEENRKNIRHRCHLTGLDLAHLSLVEVVFVALQYLRFHFFPWMGSSASGSSAGWLRSRASKSETSQARSEALRNALEMHHSAALPLLISSGLKSDPRSQISPSFASTSASQSGWSISLSQL